MSGLALTIFGTGLSAYLGKPLIGIAAPVTFNAVVVPGLAKIPWLGQILFSQDLLVYLSFGMVALFWFVLYKTKTGLIIRAVGENPGAADTAGINVFKVRYVAVYWAECWREWLAHTFFGLCSFVAGKHDGWPGLDRACFGYFCDVESGGALIGAYIFGSIDALGFICKLWALLSLHFF